MQSHLLDGLNAEEVEACLEDRRGGLAEQQTTVVDGLDL